jgi:hypothetical protein
MMTEDFAVFILTHGRANRVITYDTLRKAGYTGRIILLVDDEDKEIELYKAKYGNQVVVFSKQKAVEYTDSGDNFGKRNSVVFARNWNFVVAKERGIRYFLQLDDDYTTFRWTCDQNGTYLTKNPKTQKLDDVMEASLQFMKDVKADAVAWSQGGDFIGGTNSGLFKRYIKGELVRKIMNSFFFDTEKPVKFMGRINEDVNLYVTEGRKGRLFITLPIIRLEQITTQTNAGGLTDIYRDLGTYVKSFYTVMYAPSCVQVYEMPTTNRRLHHSVNWKNAVPMILDPKHRKKTNDEASHEATA